MYAIRSYYGAPCLEADALPQIMRRIVDRLDARSVRIRPLNGTLSAQPGSGAEGVV